MLRVMNRVCAALLVSLAAVPAWASDYQDWWWNPSLGGMGLNVGQQGDTTFVSWFLYGDDGKATFLQLSGNLNNGVLQGNLSRTTGAPPGPNYNSSSVALTTVGTATLQFTDSNSAVFTYNYEGKSGTFNLQRFTFASIGITGSKVYAGQASRSSCSISSNNGTTFGVGSMAITKDGSLYTISQFSSEGTLCVHRVTMQQQGTTFSGSGPVLCDDNVGGTTEIKKMRKVDDVLVAEYSISYNQGETCSESGKFAAIEQ